MGNSFKKGVNEAFSCAPDCCGGVNFDNEDDVDALYHLHSVNHSELEELQPFVNEPLPVLYEKAVILPPNYGYNEYSNHYGSPEPIDQPHDNPWPNNTPIDSSGYQPSDSDQTPERSITPEQIITSEQIITPERQNLTPDVQSILEMSVSSGNYFLRELLELSQLPDMDEKHGRMVFKSGSTYEGDWRGNQRHGFGTQTWPDGTVYRGQWVRNTAHGHGIFRHHDGEVYCGEWVNNSAHGEGCSIKPNGDWYAGQYQYDLQQGLGEEKGASVWLTGEFQKGHFYGKGHAIFDDGRVCISSWKDSEMDGYGRLTTAEGFTYEGAWKVGKRHGFGRSVRGKKIFEGSYVNNVAKGFAVHTKRNGQKHFGNITEGNKQHGTAVVVQPEKQYCRLIDYSEGHTVKYLANRFLTPKELLDLKV